MKLPLFLPASNPVLDSVASDLKQKALPGHPVFFPEHTRKTRPDLVPGYDCSHSMLLRLRLEQSQKLQFSAHTMPTHSVYSSQTHSTPQVCPPTSYSHFLLGYASSLTSEHLLYKDHIQHNEMTTVRPGTVPK